LIDFGRAIRYAPVLAEASRESKQLREYLLFEVVDVDH